MESSQVCEELLCIHKKQLQMRIQVIAHFVFQEKNWTKTLFTIEQKTWTLAISTKFKYFGK
jgi:hypothetical protein